MSKILNRNAASRLLMTSKRTTTVLAALALAAVSAGFVLWGVNRNHQNEVDAGTSAAAFAKSAVTKLLSYDTTSVDGLSSANASLMTSKFGQEYAQLVKTKLAPGVRQDSLTNQTNVVTTAVVSSSQSKVALLLFLNQVSSARGMSTPATTGSRVLVDLVRADGRWKIDRLDPV